MRWSKIEDYLSKFVDKFIGTLLVFTLVIFVFSIVGLMYSFFN